MMGVNELELLAAGVISGERTWIAKAITLIESSNLSDKQIANDLSEKLASRSGGSLRVGVTGSPGVGKSTFIDELGSLLTPRGY